MSNKYDIYPEHGDPQFGEKLMNLSEYQVFKVPETNIIHSPDAFDSHTKQVCTSFDKLHQHFVEHYLSHRSPYRSLLLYHSLGVGKTCSAITIAEAMLAGHVHTDGPKILVISSTALQKSFEEQIRGECTERFYQLLTSATGQQNGADEIVSDPRRMAALIKSRYEFITYDGIRAYSKDRHISNKTIIVDEAHNLRMDDDKKESAIEFEKFIKRNAKNGNRLVLLSATPMYDKPKEIYWLLGMLVQNDGYLMPPIGEMFDEHDNLNKEAHAVLKRLSGEYISFIKSMNPFTFAQRLSPAKSGIVISNEPWAAQLHDGIVPTKPGDLQLLSPHNYAAANITYPSDLASKGEEDTGFQQIFDIKPSSPNFNVTYKNGHNNAMMPTPDKLGRIAAKLLRICDLIRDTEGVVLVYSRYIYRGIVPLAIALEHMGYSRHGSNNMVSRAELVKNPVKHGNNYCILSGDANIMGQSSIEECIKAINAPNNVDGSKIKVILITQVAGEGISLRNVREVHIIEPWFHMNRIDQVIGRSIRTCSHVDLPLPKRNVTVFLHALDAPNGADANVYKNFVVKKLTQIRQIEHVIRRSALDCDIMHNMNHYSRSKFPFIVNMTSSRRVNVQIQFGDRDPAPVCDVIINPKDSNNITFNKDAYAHLIPLVVKRTVKALGVHKYLDFTSIVKAVGLHEDIVRAALPALIYPNLPKVGHRIYLHMNGLICIPDAGVGLGAVKVILPKTNVNVVKVAVADIMKRIKNDDHMVSAFRIYSLVNENQWDDVARHMIDVKEYHPLVASLKPLGMFVYGSDLGSKSAKDKAMGYVNIFDVNTLSATIRDKATGIFRRATDNETDMILNYRKKTWSINDFVRGRQTMGLFMPEKKGNAVAQNKFKVVTAEAAVGKKTGKVCTSFTHPEIVGLLTEMGNTPNAIAKKTKDELCKIAGVEMMRKNRVFTFPMYKPV